MTRLIPAFAFNAKTGQYEILNEKEIAVLKRIITPGWRVPISVVV